MRATFQHLVRHVDPDHLSVGPNDLRGDETNLSGAAAEIEHRLALAQILARIAATVIALDHFLRNDFEILADCSRPDNKALSRANFRSRGITLTDDGFRALAHLAKL